MDDLKNDEELKKTVKAIKTAQEKLEQLSKDEHERELAELRDKYIRDQYSVEKFGYERGLSEGMDVGLAEGRRSGLAEGRKSGLNEGKKVGKELGLAQGKAEIAKKMLAENYDIDTIVKLTGLTKTEIENLK